MGFRGDGGGWGHVVHGDTATWGLGDMGFRGHGSIRHAAWGRGV